MDSGIEFDVRLLSCDGIYPQAPIVVEDFAVLVAENDLAWSAVNNPRLPDEPYSEISWYSPDEIFFFSAVALSHDKPETNGRLWLWSRSYQKRITLDPADLKNSDGGLIARTREAAREIVDDPWYRSSLIPQTRTEVQTVDFDPLDQVVALLGAMNMSDPLLVRGLHKLLMSAEMRRFPHLLEESAVSAFVSREAALELLRRKLQATSERRLKLSDVLAHIREAFPTGEAFVDVLESDWDARVMMVHPVSKFGESWCPPVYAGECYDAFSSLVYLYRYFLLNEVWEPW